MIVADASALFQVLGGADKRIVARMFDRAEPICAPYLLDAEITSILRRHLLARRLDVSRAHSMLSDYMEIAITRWPHALLLRRAFALRDTMTAYDALYVALAEFLDGTLITRDLRLARAAEGIVATEVF